jgi:hypothetical protein
MQASDLKPASQFAKLYGCKALVYGAPGSGKTPLISSAPRPVLLACEPGMLSMRGSNVPTCQAFTPAAVDDFFKWFFNSNESKNFDTLAIDSVSQMADIYLQEALKKIKHGMQAYGSMATSVMDHMRPLFFFPQKHTYLICKQDIENGMARPWFPGKQLNVDIPHMYDFIIHLGIKNVPGVGQIKAFQCNESYDFLARNRTGNLNDFEEPHFGKLVAKAMM